jgi:hypothetical protein
MGGAALAGAALADPDRGRLALNGTPAASDRALDVPMLIVLGCSWLWLTTRLGDILLLPQGLQTVDYFE